jgi:hypothetical protein
MAEGCQKRCRDEKKSRGVCEDAICDTAALRKPMYMPSEDSCIRFKGRERQESRRQSLAVPGLSKTLFIPEVLRHYATLISMAFGATFSDFGRCTCNIPSL